MTDPLAAAGPPAGARHPERPAATTCSHCGSFACGDCDTIFEGRHVCATCVDEGRVARARIPWEDRDDIGFVAAAWRTVLQVSGEPTAFFDRVKSGRGRLSDAALFAFLVAIPGGIMGAAYNAAIFGFMLAPGGAMEEIFSQMGPEFVDAFREASSGWILQTIIGAVIAPFLTVAAQMAMALLHHLVLKLLGAANRELEATLEAAMYALGVNLWGVIPMVGLFVGLWVMLAQVIGYSRVHDVEIGRPIAAVLAPICLLCGGAVLFWGVLMAAFMAGVS